MAKITRKQVLSKVQALEKYLGKGGQKIIADKLGIDSKSIRRIKQGTRSGISYYNKLDKLLKNKYLLDIDLDLKKSKQKKRQAVKWLKYHKNKDNRKKVKEWRTIKKAYSNEVQINKYKIKYEIKNNEYYKAIKKKDTKKAKRIEEIKNSYENKLLKLRESGTPRMFYDSDGYKQKILLVYNHFQPLEDQEYAEFWEFLFEKSEKERFLIYMGKTPAIINNSNDLQRFIENNEEWIDSLSNQIKSGMTVNIVTANFIGKRRKVSKKEREKLTAEDLRIQM